MTEENVEPPVFVLPENPWKNMIAQGFVSQEEGMRAGRDVLLAESDFRMVPDAPWDKDVWAIYRQQLRDLPADPAWPDVEFPTPPEA